MVEVGGYVFGQRRCIRPLDMGTLRRRRRRTISIVAEEELEYNLPLQE